MNWKSALSTLPTILFVAGNILIAEVNFRDAVTKSRIGQSNFANLKTEIDESFKGVKFKSEKEEAKFRKVDRFLSDQMTAGSQVLSFQGRVAAWLHRLFFWGISLIAIIVEILLRRKKRKKLAAMTVKPEQQLTP